MQDRGYWRYMAASCFAAVILSVAVALVLKLDYIVAVLVASAAIAVATILSFKPIMFRQRRAFSRVELDVQARYPRLIHAIEELVKYEKQQSGYSIHESVLLNLRTSGRQSLQSPADY